MALQGALVVSSLEVPDLRGRSNVLIAYEAYIALYLREILDVVKRKAYFCIQSCRYNENRIVGTYTVIRSRYCQKHRYIENRVYLFCTLTVASSEAEIIRLNIGWKRTLVTGARCPERENFSGGRGIHSVGVRFSRVGAPEMNSFSASASFASSSFTYVKYMQGTLLVSYSV